MGQPAGPQFHGGAQGDPEPGTRRGGRGRPLLGDTLGLLGRRMAWIRWGIALDRFFFGLEALGTVTLLLVAVWGALELHLGLARSAHLLLQSWILGLLGLLALLTLAVALTRLPGCGMLASRLEEAEPAFQGMLLTAMEAFERPSAVPRDVALLAAERAAEILAILGFGAVRPRLPWAFLHLAALFSLAVLVGAFGLWGEAFGEALARGLFAAEAPESCLTLRIKTVEPGSIELAHGAAFRLRAVLEGGRPERVEVEFRAGEGGDPSWVPSRCGLQERGGFERGLGTVWQGTDLFVQSGFTYRLVASSGRAAPEGASVRSPWFEVQVRNRPALVSHRARIEPPAYTGWPVQELRAPGSLRALFGSRVVFTAVLAPQKDLGEGLFSLPGGRQVQALHRSGPGEGLLELEAAFLADRPGILALEVCSLGPARNNPRMDLVLSIFHDQPPCARAEIAEGAELTERGLPVLLQLEDDIGLAGAWLALKEIPGLDRSAKDGGDLEQELQIALSGYPRRVERVHWLAPGQLAGQLRSGFLYQVRVTDRAQPLPQAGRSAWARWTAQGRRPALPERQGLLGAQPGTEPRQLTRRGALNRVPDPGSVEPGELAGLGEGQARGRPGRSGRERLEDGARGRAEGDPGAAGDGQGPGRSGPGVPGPQAGEVPYEFHEVLGAKSGRGKEADADSRPRGGAGGGSGTAQGDAQPEGKGRGTGSAGADGGGQEGVSDKKGEGRASQAGAAGPGGGGGGSGEPSGGGGRGGAGASGGQPSAGSGSTGAGGSGDRNRAGVGGESRGGGAGVGGDEAGVGSQASGQERSTDQGGSGAGRAGEGAGVRGSGREEDGGAGSAGAGRSGQGSGMGAGRGASEVPGVGSEEGAGGGGSGGPRVAGSGAGGARPRDGGRKTGDEVGLGDGRNAPPDLESVGRVKERVTQAEVEAFGRMHPLGAGGRPGSSGGQGDSRVGGGVRLGNTPDTPPLSIPTAGISPGGGGGAGSGSAGLGSAHGAALDPAYKAIVDGYFQKLEAARR